MDLVVFIGIPGSGKSTFYAQRFFHTHVRVNLDMLRTRHREHLLLDFCFKTRQRLVVDNTNVTVEDRAMYLDWGRRSQFRIRGFFFRSYLPECLERNARRSGQERIPDKGVIAKFRKLQLPSLAEGFDELHYVKLEAQGFVVSPWQPGGGEERAAPMRERPD